MLALLALRFLLYERNEQYIETATIPLVLGASPWRWGAGTCSGWPGRRSSSCCFMLPLPPSINFFLANPLQRLATIGSVSCCK